MTDSKHNDPSAPPDATAVGAGATDQTPVPPAPAAPAAADTDRSVDSDVNNETAADDIPRSAPVRRESRGGGFWSGLFWALAVLAIIAAAGFELHRRAMPMLKERDDRIAALEQAVARAATNAESQRARTSDLLAAQQRAAGDIARFVERLEAQDEAIGQLREEVGGGRTRVQLAVVEQLLMLANDRLVVGREVPATIAALEAADARLAALKDPRLFAVREAIAQERAALQAVPAVDEVGASLMLSGLIERTSRLPLSAQAPTHFTASGPEPVALAADAGPWARAWAAIKQAVSSAFTIRRADGPSPQLLSVEQTDLVRQMLALKLEAARLALLRRNATSLREISVSASRWLADYFRTDDPAVIAAQADLQRLQELQLSPPLPDISRSLGLLRGLAEVQTQ
ncbi:MAG TPA: uroporphyrinogen-III C-methyltransferase [Fontimonas sp.]